MDDIDLTSGYFRGTAAEAELLLAAMDTDTPTEEELAIFWYIMPWKVMTVEGHSMHQIQPDEVVEWCQPRMRQKMAQWGYDPELVHSIMEFDQACERAWDRSELKVRVMRRLSHGDTSGVA